MDEKLFTFVIDIHGGLGNLVIASPFFYAVKNLQHIELSQYKFTKIQEAREKIQRHLEREFHQNWQAVFLVDLGLKHDNFLVECLFFHLIKIQYQFLQPLREENFSPKNIIIIAVDPIDRDPKGKPLDPKFEKRWEMDSMGFLGTETFNMLNKEELKKRGRKQTSLSSCEQKISSPPHKINDATREDFLFSGENLANIWKCWGENLSLQNEILNEGPSAYSEGLRREIENRKKALSMYVSELIELKQRKLSENRFNQDDKLITDYFNENWKKIKEEFAQEIEQSLYYAESSRRIEHFNPCELLKNIIRDHIGLNTDNVKRNFKIIRYSFPNSHEKKFKKKIVELAFLLVAIAEDEDLSNQLMKFDRHLLEIKISPSEINDPTFSKRLVEYQNCLRLCSNDIRAQLNNSTKVVLKLLESKYEKCKESINYTSSPPPQFNFFQNEEDVNKLLTWRDKLNESIIQTSKEANIKINLCLSQHREKSPEQQEHDVFNIRECAETYNTIYQQQLKNLPKEEHIAQDHDFKDSTDQTTLEIAQILKSRPHRKHLRHVLLTCLLLFITVLSFGFFKNQVPNYIDMLIFLFWVVLAIGTTTFSRYLCRKEFKKRISHLVEIVNQTGWTIIDRLIQKFEKQKEYMQKLFSLNIARQNALSAEQALLNQSETKKLSIYHLAQLNAHLGTAQRLSKLFPLTDPAYEEELGNDYEDLKKNQPESQNPIYSPATFSVTCSQHQYDIGFDNVVNSRVSEHLFGIEKILFSKDNIYSQES